MSRSRSDSSSLHIQPPSNVNNSTAIITNNHINTNNSKTTLNETELSDINIEQQQQKHLLLHNAVKKPKLSYIITLSPLNNTFEKKILILPPFPQTLKLGRPLTSSSSVNGNNNNQTVASSRNGFFESRILSRTHAQLQLTENNDILITDLNSSNGSYLNDNKLQPMNPYKVSPGDVITLGADIIPNNSNSNGANNANGIHRRIVALVEDITPVVDIGFDDHESNFNKNMLQSSLFGDFIADVNDYDLFSHGNSFLINGDEHNNGEEEGIIKIYKFLKSEIKLSNERNHKLERINMFMKNFGQDIEKLEEEKIKHLEQVKKNYYHVINESLSKKYELVQEKNLKNLKDKNVELENNFTNFKKENEEKLVDYEEQMNKMRNTVEDLETRLQVANVKKPTIDKLDKQKVINENEKIENMDKEAFVDEFESNSNINSKNIGIKSSNTINTENTNKSESKDYKIAYISSICVVGLFSAFMAYSQNK
ncbi:hypothetical protein HANVADRAFT_68771 [Hanseniaspora valbyensis NRRL Y-1626]|uniref:FHA domain-containing protein n=1 Tax=Hanseniaspora valbyensis NRRL Y-1626 TaxID=766949 RepID=A0A1B7TER1_9ASCO|nr:hypothetical protein HANVADRAFT_68771 [Hanseniaspora valbyensis NRRL Y-1626]